MRILKINSLCGIKNQMYSKEQYVGEKKKKDICDNYFDINSLFWSKILDQEHVRELLNFAKNRLSDDPSAKIKAVLQCPETFFKTYIEALKVLDTPVPEQMLFQGLETLEIICYMHSKLYSEPFTLTISSGYIHSQFSALDLANTCLMPFCNPYLSFIESEIIPKIIEYQPNMLLLTGKPNIASFAIARIIREKIPSVFIIATEYESDYYSLRKIKHLLTTNTAFFSVYHCIVLGNAKTVIKMIAQALSNDNNIDLTDVPNIIYSTDNGNTIFQTIDRIKPDFTDDFNNCVNVDQVINIKAFPSNHCYWNKCAFCGINSKYKNNQNQKWDINSFVKQVKSLYIKGIKKIWLLDEAIPADILHCIAENLIKNEIHIVWHVRTRIDPRFFDESFVELLSKAGLRHVLFGFESASNRILHLMQKFDYSFNYLEVAEKSVRALTANGISVHFSAIIGFPTETKDEIDETANFLRYLKKMYISFSYNINTFYLDIGSPIYKRWESFGILNLSYPCVPKYFLENHLNWNSTVSPNKYTKIKEYQESLMEEEYLWYPKGALLSPSTFFSFWEYSRYCLYQKSFPERSNSKSLSMNNIVMLSPMVSYKQVTKDLWLMYHLESHHYIIGGSVLHDIIIANSKGTTFSKIIKEYEMPYKSKVKSLIIQLTQMKFFI